MSPKLLCSIAINCLVAITASSIALAQSPSPWEAAEADTGATSRRSSRGVRGGSASEHTRRDNRANAHGDWGRGTSSLMSGSSEWQTSIGAPGIQCADVEAILIEGDNVYVGGRFDSAGSVAASSIAIWNRATEQWSALPGAFDGDINAIVRYQGDIVVGGDFFTVDSLFSVGVARWTGERWESVGGGMNSAVLDLHATVDALYACGAFSYAGDVTARGVAVLRNGTWAQAGNGIDGVVYALAEGNGRVYAAGRFELELNTSYGVAELADDTWSGLESGLSSSAVDLEYHDGMLYVAGDFYYAGGIRVNGIARWTGSEWQQVGSERNAGDIFALASDGDVLYASGAFTILDGVRVNGVARWDGVAWEPVGDVNGRATALAVSNGSVFAGGQFTRADAASVNNVARFESGEWRAMGEGLRNGSYAGYVAALERIGDEIFIGGKFSHAGGARSLNVVSWNVRTGEWSALGDGVNAPVSGFAEHNGQLIVCGQFTRAGDETANHIAQFDPATRTWSTLSTGIRPEVLDVVSADGELVIASDGVFKWDGSRLLFSSNGPEGWVYSVAAHDGELFAAGRFVNSGDVDTRGIARLNASGWQGLGDGIDGYVLDMKVHDGKLVAGGYFESRDNPLAENVALWDGSAWSPVGDAPDGEIRSMGSRDGALYVGGWFESAGGAPAANVARYAEGEWSALGDGTDWLVYAVLPQDEGVFVGGFFAEAGGRPSSNIALWSPPMSTGQSATHEAPTLNVYPNPSSASISIELVGAGAREGHVDMIDGLGRVVTTRALESSARTHIDCSLLATGSYSLRCVTSAGVSTRRVVVVR